ncbi:MAG TPA: MFS transporter [Verrucomicrobiae bacterium]|nr:MFS transporter [Verrucomicrobiae bacterium]
MAAPSLARPHPRVGKFRWTVCALLFFATLINYMDRQIIGILKPHLSTLFHWSEEDYGHIVMAFHAAYAVGQVLTGPFIEWVGTKNAYALSVGFWSLAAMAHALARSVLGFGSVRFGLGLAESGNFPTAIQSVTEWFPQQERSLATGIFNTGSSVGVIVAPVLVPWLTLEFGWRTAFAVLGASGFVWLLFWFAFYDLPERSRRLKPNERAFVRGDGQAFLPERLPWKKVLGYRQTWAYVVCGLITAPVWWFYLFWLPDFFNKQFGLNLKDFGPPLVAVYLVTGLGSIAGGGLSGWLLQRGWSLNWARKTAALACACGAVPVALATHTRSVWLATSFFALATAANQGWSATMYTVVSDIFPKRAVASVVGLGGMFSSVSAMGFSWLVGHILQSTGAYDQILLLCGAAYLVTWLIFHLLVPQIGPIEIP